jgi:hypothetical protein
MEALIEAARPDYRLSATFCRFRDLATERFSKLRCPDKRLSVVVAGHDYSAEPFTLAGFVSNFERQMGTESAARARPEFEVECIEMLTSRTDYFPPISFPLGRDIKEDGRRLLRHMMRRNISPRVVVSQAVEAIRAMVPAEQCEGTVGGRCSSAIVWRDPECAVETAYHTDTCTEAMHDVPQVFAIPGMELAIEPHISVAHADGSPGVMAVPRVGRNAPCPCGSGQKFKHCHGL